MGLHHVVPDAQDRLIGIDAVPGLSTMRNSLNECDVARAVEVFSLMRGGEEWRWQRLMPRNVKR